MKFFMKIEQNLCALGKLKEFQYTTAYGPIRPISISSKYFKVQSIVLFYFYCNYPPPHPGQQYFSLALPMLHQFLLCRILQRLDTVSSA